MRLNSVGVGSSWSWKVQTTMDHAAVKLPASNKLYFKDPRVMRLALKYIYLWKAQCPGLQARNRGQVDSERCSVHHVIIRASDGALHIVRQAQLPRLKVGSEPYGDGRIRARVRHMPAQLPQDLHYVPMDIAQYSGSDAPDLAVLLFTGPTRVYLLLPTLMREPRWLRDLFVKVRDPASGNHLGLTTSWHFNSGFALLLASGMKYQAFVRQRLMVWESTKVYDADEELVLGGPGHAEMGDTVFVIAARSLTCAVGPSNQQQPPNPFQRPQAQLQLARGPLSRLVLVRSDAISETLPYFPSPDASAAARPVAAVQLENSRAMDSNLSYTAAQQDLERPSGMLFLRRTGDGAGVTEVGAAAAAASSGGGVGAAGGSAAMTGTAGLLQRFIKAVKRDRVQDLRALLNSDPWRRYCMSPSDVSFLPAGERYPLVVDLSVSNMSLPVLVELVDRAGCHLNYRSLKFLVGCWDRLPDHCGGGGEGLLLRYLVRHPNPLSVVGACLLAMRAELVAGRNHSTALRQAVPRFQAVQMALMEQLQDSYFRTSEESRRTAGLPLLEDILEQPQSIIMGGASRGGSSGANGGGGGGGAPCGSWSSPPLQPVVLSDYSPLRLAFRDHDTQFMSAQLIEAYTRHRWLGPEFAALTCLDGHHRLSGLDPLLVYTIVENLGFVGDAGAASMQATFRLWHLCTMTSSAFFRSPRGRWAMKFMSTIAFLAMYMVVLMSYDKVRLPTSEGGGRWRAVHTAFLVFTGGNLLEGVEVVTMRYQNSAGRYFMSAPGEVLGILVDVGVFACATPCLLAAYIDNSRGVVSGGWNEHQNGSGSDDASDVSPYMTDEQWMTLRLALATLAIFVYLRSLAIMVPLYRKLGPLIRTMTRMAAEVLAFVPLYVSVTLGFATALTCTLGKEVAGYGTFMGAVLQLFEATLGTFSYGVFDVLDEQRRLYAIILFTVYLVLAALLLTNLLIAIMSYKYRPEEVRAESVFDLAEMVDRYRFQVRHHLICSPFNLVLLLFAWLPSASLPKISPYEWVKYGLTPLDGLTFATPRHLTTPGGRDELPHLCYLLTLYPLIIAAANVLYYLHAPYTVLYWALTGHRKLLRELLGGNGAVVDSNSGIGGGGAAAAKSLPSAFLSGPSRHLFSVGFGSSVNQSQPIRTALSPGLRAQAEVPLPPPPPPLQSPLGRQPSDSVAKGTEDATTRQVSMLLAAAATAAGAQTAATSGPSISAATVHSAGSGNGRGAKSLDLDSRVAGGYASGAWVSDPISEGNDLYDGDTSANDEAVSGTRFERVIVVSERSPVSQRSSGEEAGPASIGHGGGLRSGRRPLAESVERPTGRRAGDAAGSGVAGAPERSVSAVDWMETALSPSKSLLFKGGGGGGGVVLRPGGGPAGLRARSVRGMQLYLTSGDPGGSVSDRNLSGRLDEASLIDDMSDGAGIQPPYMALLRLATLRGLRDAVLSVGRFAVLVVAGTLLYVIVMGVLAGTLGCCLVVWAGSVGVSIGRIIFGAWLGLGDGDDGSGALCGGGSADKGGTSAGAGAGTEASAAGGAGGSGGGVGSAASGSPTSTAAGRWVSLARLARNRATRTTYLTREQIQTAVRNVYAAGDMLAAQDVDDGAVGIGAAGWAAVASRVYRNPALIAASAFSRQLEVLRSVLGDGAQAPKVGGPPSASAASAAAAPGVAPLPAPTDGAPSAQLGSPLRGEASDAALAAAAAAAAAPPSWSSPAVRNAVSQRPRGASWAALAAAEPRSMSASLLHIGDPESISPRATSMPPRRLLLERPSAGIGGGDGLDGRDGGEFDGLAQPRRRALLPRPLAAATATAAAATSPPPGGNAAAETMLAPNLMAPGTMAAPHRLAAVPDGVGSPRQIASPGLRLLRDEASVGAAGGAGVTYGCSNDHGRFGGASSAAGAQATFPPTSYHRSSSGAGGGMSDRRPSLDYGDGAAVASAGADTGASNSLYGWSNLRLPGAVGSISGPPAASAVAGPTAPSLPSNAAEQLFASAGAGGGADGAR